MAEAERIAAEGGEVRRLRPGSGTSRIFAPGLVGFSGVGAQVGALGDGKMLFDVCFACWELLWMFIFCMFFLNFEKGWEGQKDLNHSKCTERYSNNTFPFFVGPTSYPG